MTTQTDHRALLSAIVDLTPVDELAAAWRVDRNTIYRWLRGDRAISGPAQILIEDRAARDGITIAGKFFPRENP